MNLEPPHVCIATVGGQPQVVTLALDVLLAQGVPISELIVVHLSTDTPRYRAALACLSHAFSGDRYGDRVCRYRPLPLLLGTTPIDDLVSEGAVDTTLNLLQRLLHQLKQQGATVHLCLTGGRRMLGQLALTAAQVYCDQTDRVWHLYSSDEVRRQTDRGAVLHLPGHPDVRLVRVPMQPWGHLFPVLRPDPDLRESVRMNGTNHTRCQQVYERLTERQREVLRAFAAGRTPQEAADELCVTVATINAHKTPIFQECCAVWGLPPGTRLDYRWLREHFATYVAV